MSKKFYAVALGLLVAAVGLVSGTAQASRGVSLSATTISASGQLTLNGSVICTVSLTLVARSSTVTKTVGTTQANVTAGTITACSGLGMQRGTVLIPAGGIPVQYASFSGTLPSITSININAINPGFEITGTLATCLYQGNLNGIRFVVSGGRVTAASFTGSNALPLSRGTLFCPSTGTITGSLAVAAPPTVTLV